MSKEIDWSKAPETCLREKALETFDYDKDSGLLTRKSCKQSRFIGKPVGYVTHHGYLRVHVFNTRIDAHRLIWLMVYGFLPDCEIDHVNRNKLDNRLENLRLASQQKNQQNTSVRSDNSLGVKGVRLRSSGKYQARVKLTDGSRLTKTFSDIYSAVQWLAQSRINSHGEFSHTPEQIEAEERKSEINEMENVVIAAASEWQTSINADVAIRALHAAGYRKTEAGK